MNFHFYIDLIYLIYFSTFITNTICDKYSALIFDQKDHSIIDIEQEINSGLKEMGRPTAIACPAYQPKEESFNDNSSLGKNSLFVRSTQSPFINPNKVDYKTCEYPYNMSICYHKPSTEILFGYEIYTTIVIGFKFDTFADFSPISQAYSWRSYLFPKFSTPKLELNANQPLKFLWILSFRLNFDNRHTLLRQVIYTVSSDTKTTLPCNNYDLGKEIYESKKLDLDELYRKQNETFNNVDLRSESECKLENQCLVKYSLIPQEEFYFHPPQKEIISCSNLTTVPVWKSTIKNMLDKLDRFLYALSKAINKNFTIISGIHGVLQMPIQDSKKLKKITLGTKGEISVPNIIYKVVKYNCSMPIGNPNDVIQKSIPATKAVIIIFHNDPYFETSHIDCEYENCENWGWREILNEHIPSQGPASHYVFCCLRNKDTVEKLGMEYDNETTTEMNLNMLPIYNSKERRTEIKNVVSDVIKEMQQMTGFQRT